MKSNRKKTYYVAYTDASADELSLDDVSRAETSIKKALQDASGYRGIPLYRMTVEMTECVEVDRKGRPKESRRA